MLGKQNEWLPANTDLIVQNRSPQMGLPLVSAIIATYNRGYIVAEAINSILQQTYPRIEIIVVDDGSTDDTPARLRAYGDRIRVVDQPNGGPAAAWNAGIKAAKGTIITFLGSDDVWLPAFVERQVSVLERAGPSVPCCLCNAKAKFASGLDTSSFELADLRPPTTEGLWLNAFDILTTRFVMCGQMLAIRTDVLRKIGAFDETLRYLEDYDIALRLALEGPWAFIREPLVSFRQSTTGDSLSLSISAEEARLHQYILTIRQKANMLMKSRQPQVRSQYMKAAIRKAKRDIWFATLRQKRSAATRVVVLTYRAFDRYRSAIYRRSLFFPRMRIAPLERA